MKRFHILRQDSRVKNTLYFISAPDCGSVKIGITENLTRRLRDLRNASPAPLELLLAVPATTRQEAAVHFRFLSDRSHGEWFRMSDDIASFIATLAMSNDLGASKLRSLRGGVVPRLNPRRARAS